MVLHLWVMIASSSIALCMATGSPWPFAVTPALAALMLPIVGVDGRRGLGPTTTALLAAGACLLAAIEWRSAFGGAALGVAHLLAYATWLAMLRRGRREKVWVLVTLSAFHVAAVALTEHSIWLLFALPFLVHGGIVVLHDVARSATTNRGAVVGPTKRMRLLALETEDPRNPARVPRASLVGASVGTLVVGTLLFAVVPRPTALSAFESIAFEESAVRRMRFRETGYSEHVRLGESGRLGSGDEVALRVRFLDAANEPLDVEEFFATRGLGTPYFRGSVPGAYSNGNWLPNQAYVGRSRVRPRWAFADDEVDPPGEVVRQEWDVEQMGAGALFVGPDTLTCRTTAPPWRVLHEEQSDTWSVFPRIGGHRWRAELRVRPLQYTTFASESPLPKWGQAGGTRFLDVQTARLPRLAELARRLADESGTTSSSAAELAKSVAQHLASGRYVYSLDAPPVEGGEDPVETFLFETRVGNCEHFATAMTLLLRAGGVPARLVNGYRGGEKDADSPWFVVRRKHAHTWVEAFVDGSWRLHDPTPGGDDLDDDERLSWRVAQSGLNHLWYHGVVQFSWRSQVEVVRDVSSNVRSTVVAVVSGARSLISRANDEVRRVPSPSGWTRVVLLSYVMLAVSWLWLRHKGSATATSDRESGGPVNALFERFADWADRRGVTRMDSQTPLELSERVQGEMTEVLKRTQATDLPAKLVGLLYRVRFGREVPTPDEVGALEAVIRRLEMG